MPNLYPTFEMPALTEPEAAATPTYGKSWFFDLMKGDFVLDGAGRVAKTNEHVAWAHWCVKAVLTERFAYLAYGTDYGCEIEQARKHQSRETVEAELERVITEALLADPRTETVRDFVFRGVADEIFITFLITPVIGIPERVEVKLSA